MHSKSILKNPLKLTLFICLFVSTLSYGQFAIRAGLNMSNIALEVDGTETSFSDKLGFHFGLVGDLVISDKLSFRPGLLYSQRGAKIDLLGLIEIKTSLNYLDIPLSFNYAFNSREKGIFLEFGPNIQYLLSAKIEADGESEDAKDAYKTIDFGLLIGLGYKVNSNISIGINYNLGFANIANEEDPEEEVSTKNRNIGVYASYSF